MPNDNYRVQHGCWDCEHAGHDIDGHSYYCMLTPNIGEVHHAGICDSHPSIAAVRSVKERKLCLK